MTPLPAPLLTYCWNGLLPLVTDSVWISTTEFAHYSTTDLIVLESCDPVLTILEVS